MRIGRGVVVCCTLNGVLCTVNENWAWVVVSETLKVVISRRRNGVPAIGRLCVFGLVGRSLYGWVHGLVRQLEGST